MGTFSGFRTLPTATSSVFSRIITLGWYDGITSGLAECQSDRSAVRFDLLAWGPSQERRVFALSSLPPLAFDKVVAILELQSAPKWPRWDPPWPKGQKEGEGLNRALDEVLAGSGKPDYAIETESMFETVYAARDLSQVPQGMIPDRFECYPQSDNYELWHRYLEAQS